MTFPTSFPPQHQDQQPGLEHMMNPLPIYDDDKYVAKGNSLQDKVALITGGDSGIGRAVALAFAKQGAHVVIVYLNETKDAETIKAKIEALGRQCLLIETDITENANCITAINQTITHFNKLDILVNNAAVQHEAQGLDLIPDAQFDQTFKTNVYGAFYMTKAALPHLKAGASIINTTSVVAFRGSENLIDYSMTKGALTVFTRSLAMSLAKSKSGIRVNAVAPGPIWTPFIPSCTAAQNVASFGSGTLLGRAGQPIECAGAYVFLASEAASYITGQTIHVNGGEIVNA